jgi:hypothetical protein
MIVKLEGAEDLKHNHHSKRQDIFIINGQYQPMGEKGFERLILQLVQTIPRYIPSDAGRNQPTGSSISTPWPIAMPTTTSRRS